MSFLLKICCNRWGWLDGLKSKTENSVDFLVLPRLRYGLDPRRGLAMGVVFAIAIDPARADGSCSG